MFREIHLPIIGSPMDRGVAAAPKVADLMADILGWDQAEKKREVDAYIGRVAAERKSQTEPDDDTAEAARLGAPEIRPPVPIRGL